MYMKYIIFKPFEPHGFLHPYQLDGPVHFRFKACLVVFFFILKSNILLAISEDPDQTPRSAASNLGLHCLSMFHKKDARHIRAN